MCSLTFYAGKIKIYYMHMKGYYMKRVISFVLILALVLVFAGCSSSSPSSSKNLGGLVPNMGTGKTTGGSSASAAPAVTAPAGSSAPGTSSAAVADNGIVNSLKAFYNVQYSSLQLLYKKIQSGEEDQNLVKSVEASYALYQCTNSVLPIEAIAGGDMQSSLEEGGISGINITKNGDVYTMSFTTQENTYKIEAQYDSATDSMTAKLYSSDQLEITYEYAAESSGYAAQAFADNGSGQYEIYTGLVNGTSVADFGLSTSTTAPQSIFKNKSLTADFIKSGSFYCIYDGTTLTVTDSGTTTTY